MELCNSNLFELEQYLCLFLQFLAFAYPQVPSADLSLCLFVLFYVGPPPGCMTSNLDYHQFSRSLSSHRYRTSAYHSFMTRLSNPLRFSFFTFSSSFSFFPSSVFRSYSCSPCLLWPALIHQPHWLSLFTILLINCFPFHLSSSTLLRFTVIISIHLRLHGPTSTLILCFHRHPL